MNIITQKTRTGNVVITQQSHSNIKPTPQLFYGDSKWDLTFRTTKKTINCAYAPVAQPTKSQT